MEKYVQDEIVFPEPEEEGDNKIEEIDTIKYNSEEKTEGEEKMTVVPEKDVELVRKMVNITEGKYSGRDIYYIQEKLENFIQDIIPPNVKSPFGWLKRRADKYLAAYHRGGWKTKKYTGLKEGWKLPPEPEQKPTWNSHSGYIMDALDDKEKFKDETEE